MLSFSRKIALVYQGSIENDTITLIPTKRMQQNERALAELEKTRERAIQDILKAKNDPLG